MSRGSPKLEKKQGAGSQWNPRVQFFVWLSALGPTALCALCQLLHPSHNQKQMKEGPVHPYQDPFDGPTPHLQHFGEPVSIPMPSPFTAAAAAGSAHRPAAAMPPSAAAATAGEGHADAYAKILGGPAAAPAGAPGTDVLLIEQNPQISRLLLPLKVLRLLQVGVAAPANTCPSSADHSGQYSTASVGSANCSVQPGCTHLLRYRVADLPALAAAAGVLP